jgi:hypothetical protein
MGIKKLNEHIYLRAGTVDAPAAPHLMDALSGFRMVISAEETSFALARCRSIIAPNIG